MDTSAIDFSALVLGLVASALITGAVAWGARRGGRAPLWIAAAAVTAVLMAIGLVDLMREQPRETHVATVLVGIPAPVLGALGLQYAMRRVRPSIRWGAVFIAVLLLLFLGLLMGATIVPRFLGA